MRLWVQRVIVGATASIGIYAAMAGLLVIFGTSRPPPVSTLITGPFAAIDASALPPIKRYRARDGAQLTYREYAGSSSQSAVLIHGSAGSSADMHPLAMLLRARGYTVYVPDLRGHGENRPHGDLAYLGQLDDDMEDFLQTLGRGDAAGPRTLIGFSSGGGFALRIAARPRIAQYFQHVVLLAPYLRYDAPSVRQETADPSGAASSTSPWAVAYIPRIIGLTMLNRLGIHGLDSLPVVAFAVPPDSSGVTRTYSWRMQQNFGAHDDYGTDILALPDSSIVLVGTEDTILVPTALRTEFQSRRPGIPVYCVPKADHSGLVTMPSSLEAILDVIAGHTDSTLLAACVVESSRN
jgi:non-heme chloroperoxidase